jgi:hypothetical protein
MMFDSFQSHERGFSAPLFLAQFFVTPLGGLVVGGIATMLLEGLFFTKNSTVFAYLAYSLQGLLLGFRMQAAFPRAVESGGRWVCIFPLCNAVFWVLDEAKRGSNSHLDYFFIARQRPGLHGVEMYVIVLPAVASCTYSYGVTLASRPQRNTRERYLHHLFSRENSADSSGVGT